VRRAYPESELHKTVAKYLDLILYPSTWWTSIGHGNRGKPVRGALWKAQGAKKGVPDILIVYNGWVYFIELKSESGKLSPEQVKCHETITAAHGRVAVCRSIDDVAESLAEWGIRTRDGAVTKRAA
jgi:hypothetical protein